MNDAFIKELANNDYDFVMERSETFNRFFITFYVGRFPIKMVWWG